MNSINTYIPLAKNYKSKVLFVKQYACKYKDNIPFVQTFSQKILPLWQI